MSARGPAAARRLRDQGHEVPSVFEEAGGMEKDSSDQQEHYH